MNFLKNLALVFCSILLGLFFCEIVLSMFGVVDRYSILNTPVGRSHFILYNHNELDRDQSWFTRLTQTPFPKDPFTIGKTTVSSSDREKKIFFIGDSGTFGVGVKSEETFSSVTQDNLKKRFPDLALKVINAGVVGATPPDTFWVFDKYFKILKPDVVIYSVFLANDINQSLMEVDFEKFNFDPLLAKSALYKLLYIIKLKYRIEARELSPFMMNFDSRQEDELGLKIMDFIDGEVASYQNPATDLYRIAQKKFFNILIRMKKICDAEGIVFRVVLIPTRSFVEDNLDIQPIDFDLKQKLKERGIWEKLNLDFSKSRDDVLAFLKENEVQFIDKSDELKKKFKADTFNLNDDHLSAQAHRLIAEEVADNLTSELLDEENSR